MNTKEKLKATEAILREAGFSPANSTDTRRGRTLVVIEHWTGPHGIAIFERWHPTTTEGGMSADFNQCEYCEVFFPATHGAPTWENMWTGMKAAIARRAPGAKVAAKGDAIERAEAQRADAGPYGRIE